MSFPFAAGVPLLETADHAHADGSITTAEFTPFVFSPPEACWDRIQQSVPEEDLTHFESVGPIDITEADDQLVALSKAIAALREFGVVVLTGVSLQEEIPSESVAASVACFPLMLQAFVMKLCDGIIGRQVLGMDTEDLASAMVPPSLFTDGRPIQQIPWEMQEARNVRAAAGAEQEWVRSEDGGAPGFDFHSTLLQHQLEVMWALEPSTTVQCVPRSHNWPRHRIPTATQLLEWKAARRGDALVFVGSLLHKQCALWLPSRLLETTLKHRLVGYSMPGPILNKLYCGAPDTVHLGVLAAYEAYGERTVDWAGAAVSQPHAQEMTALMGSCLPSRGLHVGSPALAALLQALPEGLVTVEAHDPAAGAKLLAALVRDGGAVLSRAVSHKVCDALLADLEPYSADVGGATVGCVLSRSSASWPIAAHPVVLEVCDAVLSRQALRMTTRQLGRATKHHRRAQASVDGFPYQVHCLPDSPTWFHSTPAGAIILIAVKLQVHVNLTIPKQPGSGRQTLHRDGDLSLLDVAGLCGVDHAVSCIWAVDGDFTEERGTTRVVLGSHEWNPARVASPEESIPAEMTRGSCFLYTGRTIHGAGHNQTTSPRTAFNVAYNSACLKQEENMFVSTPLAIAKDLPAPLPRLLGYTY